MLQKYLKNPMFNHLMSVRIILITDVRIYRKKFCDHHRSTSTHLLNLYWLSDLYHPLSIKISSTPHPPKGLKNNENFNAQQIFSPSSSLGQPKVKSVFSFIRFVILKDLFTLLTRSDSVGRSRGQRPCVST